MCDSGNPCARPRSAPAGRAGRDGWRRSMGAGAPSIAEIAAKVADSTPSDTSIRPPRPSCWRLEPRKNHDPGSDQGRLGHRSERCQGVIGFVFQKNRESRTRIPEADGLVRFFRRHRVLQRGLAPAGPDCAGRRTRLALGPVGGSHCLRIPSDDRYDRDIARAKPNGQRRRSEPA